MLEKIVWLGKFIGWIGGGLFICYSAFKILSRICVRSIGRICRFDKDKIIKEIFERPSQYQVLIKEAKRKIGRIKYQWLIECYGLKSKGAKCEIEERGKYLRKIDEFERRLKATEEISRLPSLQEAEKIERDLEKEKRDLLISIVKEIVKEIGKLKRWNNL